VSNRASAVQNSQNIGEVVSWALAQSRLSQLDADYFGSLPIDVGIEAGQVVSVRIAGRIYKKSDWNGIDTGKKGGFNTRRM